VINSDLLWYLLAPLFLSAGTIFILHKFMSGITWVQSTLAAMAGLVVSALIISGAFYAGKGGKTADTEIWNGEVVSKARVQGSYVESYQCHCYTYTTSSGSGKNRTTTSHTHCDTCYRDHYTVNWGCDTNIGHFGIESLDETSSSVYNTPDPGRYTIIQKGDPVSKTHDYTNFIKAVPETLFRPAQASLKAQYMGKIPAYPINIYDIYHVDRVLAVDVPITNLREWNDKLSNALKTLGPAKQANAVIVFTKYGPDYFYALQDAWLNGKKNDIVVVIGASRFPGHADWVKIMALTQDQIFQVKLRDDIMDIGILTPDAVIGALQKDVMSDFKRKHMADFKYLDAEIDPPAWVMVTCLILIFGAYFGFWIYLFMHPINRRYY
jgi:hypothetical protein